MKAAVFYGAVSGRDLGLLEVADILQNIMKELEVDYQLFNLFERNLPFYSGAIDESVKELSKAAKESDCILFLFTTEMYMPSAVMKNLLDHLQNIYYENALQDKRCMVVTVSELTGETESVDYFVKALQGLGGIAVFKIAVGGQEQQLIGKAPYIKEILEKNMEDFYRIVRQNRKYFKSSSGTVFDSIRAVKPKKSPVKEIKETLNAYPDLSGFSERLDAVLQEEKNTKALSPGFEEFTEKQSQDIEELTKLFAAKVTEEANYSQAGVYQKPAAASPVPRAKSCKQLTQSLVHYFQPQLAGDLAVIYQINISGEENFECFITIRGTVCEFFEGTKDDADIFIYADSKVWTDVLKGKYTAQKSFMTGLLKVRGNFVLLNKFDQLFKML